MLTVVHSSNIDAYEQSIKWLVKKATITQYGIVWNQHI